MISDPISQTLLEADLTAWVTMVAFAVFSVIVCTFVSHTVGAIILTPIIVEISSTLGMHECREVVLSAAIMYRYAYHIVRLCALFNCTSFVACSAAGALPMSSFPNINSLMIEDENERKYLSPVDFIKYGGGMTIIGFAVTVTWGYLLMSHVL